MNMDKWIEQKRMHSGITYNGDDVYAINVEDLRELLKTHAVIPRLLTDDQGEAIFDAAHDTDGDIRVMHKVMIEAAESE